MIKVCTEESIIHCETNGPRITLAAQVVALLRTLLKDNPEIVHAAFILLEKELTDFDNVDLTGIALLYGCLGGDDKNILKLLMRRSANDCD